MGGWGGWIPNLMPRALELRLLSTQLSLETTQILSLDDDDSGNAMPWPRICGPCACGLDA
jgi:hypothetical protein